jgi:hypothetical protein
MAANHTQSAPTRSREDSIIDRKLAVNYQYTPVLPEILAHLDTSILVSTYQAGKVLVIGVHEQRLQVSFLDFDQPMGIAVGADRIAIGAKSEIRFLKANHAAAAAVKPQKTFDGCYVAQSSRHTGRILGHDLGWGNERAWATQLKPSSKSLNQTPAIELSEGMKLRFQTVGSTSLDAPNVGRLPDCFLNFRCSIQKNINVPVVDSTIATPLAESQAALITRQAQTNERSRQHSKTLTRCNATNQLYQSRFKPLIDDKKKLMSNELCEHYIHAT